MCLALDMALSVIVLDLSMPHPPTERVGSLRSGSSEQQTQQGALRVLDLRVFLRKIYSYGQEASWFANSPAAVDKRFDTPCCQHGL